MYLLIFQLPLPLFLCAIDLIFHLQMFLFLNFKYQRCFLGVVAIIFCLQISMPLINYTYFLRKSDLLSHLNTNPPLLFHIQSYYFQIISLLCWLQMYFPPSPDIMICPHSQTGLLNPLQLKLWHFYFLPPWWRGVSSKYVCMNSLPTIILIT